MQRACKGKQRATRSGKRKSQTVCRVEEESEPEEETAQSSLLYHVKSSGVSHSPPIQVKVKLDEYLVSMEVDTGTGLSLMSEATFRCLWPGLDLAYSKEPIPVLGQCNVNIDNQGQTAKMPLFIVEGS